MDRQAAIDRITETENLTDGLEDDDANWLLDWGIARVDGLLAGAPDDDTAGDRVNRLMAVMRTLNQIVADRAAKSPSDLAADLAALRDRYASTFGAAAAPSPESASAERAAALGSMTPRAALEALTGWLQSPQESAAGPPASAPPSPPLPTSVDAPKPDGGASPPTPPELSPPTPSASPAPSASPEPSPPAPLASPPAYPASAAHTRTSPRPPSRAARRRPKKENPRE